jgi:hypothetical protein
MLLSKDECEYIKSFWDESISNGSSKYLQRKLNDGTTITYRTNVSGRYIDFQTNKLLEDFLLEKLKPLGVISLSSSIKLARYSKGDYFEPHHDFNYYGEGALYKTLVLQLSDPTTYVGGDLIVKGIPQTRTQGDYSLFLSSDIHEVKLIESGYRFSLTMFLLESDFINQKSIL